MTGVAHANNERGPVVVRTRPQRHILSLTNTWERTRLPTPEIPGWPQVKTTSPCSDGETLNLETLPAVPVPWRHFCKV
jgi:hypothetical protein